MTIDKNALFQALLSAFPSKGKLQMMLGQRFDVLYADLTPEDARDVEYWNIVQQVEAEGWLPELARAAFETVPQNPRVSALAIGTGLTSLSPTPAAGLGTTVLEKMVKEGALLMDVPAFLDRLSMLEGQVCRIEAPEGTALGTGFLVGAEMVMTNHHVISGLIGTTTQAICRFDFLTDAQGIAVRAGVTVPFAPDWHVISVAHDPADTSLDDNDAPAPDRLDTAILRLARPAGQEARRGTVGPENRARGWVALDAGGTVEIGREIFILQHPRAAAMKMGLGRISALPWNGLRMRYDATTESGSSGAPVLDAALRLIGLHHLGDPNEFRTATFNQAVPVSKILPWLTEALPAPHFWDQRP
ncbi:MAG: trypsin-like peptidase domain-containing protein [Paracoccaceae bacterium]